MTEEHESFGMSDDVFLQVTGVKTEESAMRDSLAAALQHNPTYLESTDEKTRLAIRSEWARRGRSLVYRGNTTTVGRKILTVLKLDGREFVSGVSQH